MACPGSVRLCATVPNVGSAYAAEGTAAHALAEHCLRERDKAANYIGETFEKYKVTEEMAEAVQVYLDAVDARADAFPDNELNVEEKFHLAAIDPDAFGTNDSSVFEPSTATLYVFDYKHGAGYAVEVLENPQLLYYATGAAFKHGNRALDKIVMTIVQPRAPHRDGPVRSVIVTNLELLDWSQDLREAIAATREPDAKLVSGSQCRFCPAAGVCPRLHDDSIAAATNEFGMVAQAEAVPQMTNAQLVALLDKAGLIETWLTAVRRFAYQQALAGHMQETHKFVAKRANRKWHDETAALAKLKSLAVPLEKITTIRTPAQVEKAVGPLVYDLIADDHVFKQSAGVNLVLRSHPGAEVPAPGSGGDFDDVSIDD